MSWYQIPYNNESTAGADDSVEGPKLYKNEANSMHTTYSEYVKERASLDS